MKNYKTENLRNVGIIGHGDLGKITLTEAILYYTKAADRFGKVDEGTAVSDYDLKEKKRKISISATVVNCEYDGRKVI